MSTLKKQVKVQEGLLHFLKTLNIKEDLDQAEIFEVYKELDYFLGFSDEADVFLKAYKRYLTTLFGDLYVSLYDQLPEKYDDFTMKDYTGKLTQQIAILPPKPERTFYSGHNTHYWRGNNHYNSNRGYVTYSDRLYLSSHVKKAGESGSQYYCLDVHKPAGHSSFTNVECSAYGYCLSDPPKEFIDQLKGERKNTLFFPLTKEGALRYKGTIVTVDGILMGKVTYTNFSGKKGTLVISGGTKKLEKLDS